MSSVDFSFNADVAFNARSPDFFNFLSTFSMSNRILVSFPISNRVGPFAYNHYFCLGTKTDPYCIPNKISAQQIQTLFFNFSEFFFIDTNEKVQMKESSIHQRKVLQ